MGYQHATHSLHYLFGIVGIAVASVKSLAIMMLCLKLPLPDRGGSWLYNKLIWHANVLHCTVSSSKQQTLRGGETAVGHKNCHQVGQRILWWTEIVYRIFFCFCLSVPKQSFVSFSPDNHL